MVDQDIKMDTEKVLSDKGEKRLFNAIMKCIDEKIDAILNPSQMSEKSKELEDAEKELYSVIKGLKWVAK